MRRRQDDEDADQIVAVSLAATLLLGARPAGTETSQDILAHYLGLDLASKQSEAMATALLMNEAERRVVWAVYDAYQRELTRVSNEREALLREYLKEAAAVDDARADALIAKGFEMQERRTALLKKYAEGTAEANARETCPQIRPSRAAVTTPDGPAGRRLARGPPLKCQRGSARSLAKAMRWHCVLREVLHAQVQDRTRRAGGHCRSGRRGPSYEDLQGSGLGAFHADPCWSEEITMNGLALDAGRSRNEHRERSGSAGWFSPPRSSAGRKNRAQRHMVDGNRM